MYLLSSSAAEASAAVATTFSQTAILTSKLPSRETDVWRVQQSRYYYRGGVSEVHDDFGNSVFPKYDVTETIYKDRFGTYETLRMCKATPIPALD